MKSEFRSRRAEKAGQFYCSGQWVGLGDGGDDPSDEDQKGEVGDWVLILD